MKSKILKLLSINLDIFLRTIFLTFAFLWIIYLGSKIGEDYLAVNTILLQFIILASFFRCLCFLNRRNCRIFNWKKKPKIFFNNCQKFISSKFFTALIISIIYIIFFKEIVNIITDIEILRFISFHIFYWVIIIPPVACFCYQLDGIFIGASQTKEIRNAMIISVIGYVGVSIMLTRYLGNLVYGSLFYCL